MATYEFDHERRRQVRNEKKAAQQRQQKKQKRMLAILAAAVLLAVVAAVMIFGGGEAPLETVPPTTVPPTTYPIETLADGTEAPKPSGTTVINIAVAGDLNVTDYVLNNAAHENGYDFTQAFLDVAPLFSGADLALLNFEGNLSGGRYGTETGAAPLELPKALKAIGIDAVQTANSASIRQGVSGLVATLDAFDMVGLKTLGTFASSSDFRKTGGYEIIEVEGIRIALIAFTKGMDNLGLPSGSEDCVNLLYEDYATDYKKVDTDAIARVLRNVNAEMPDLTIAMVHWGSEYNDEISNSQKKIRNQLQEGGVDIIVGTHPHMVQQIDYDPVAKTLVAWSLGDFFGDAQMAGSNYSVMLELQITRDHASGEVFLSGYEYIPLFILKPEQSAVGGHRVVRLREALARYEADFVGRVTDGAYSDMAYALTRIEKRVNPETKN